MKMFAKAVLKYDLKQEKKNLFNIHVHIISSIYKICLSSPFLTL